VSIKGVSYGRCKKFWDDFEELYDSLEQSHGELLQGIPFPTYITRRDKTKQEAVEDNRKNLQTLLVRVAIGARMYVLAAKLARFRKVPACKVETALTRHRAAFRPADSVVATP